MSKTETSSSATPGGPERTLTAAEEAWDVAKTVLIAVGLTLLVRFFFFQPFNIPSGSMKPTLEIGDFIVVDKVEYGYSRASLIFPLTRLPLEGRVFADVPSQGEIVVFKNYADRNRDYIKRVIGTPGDKIQMVEGNLFLNGQMVEREQLDVPTDCSDNTLGRMYRETLPGGVSYRVQECSGNFGREDNTPVFTVPDGHFFMMGDNRDNSADSRTPTVGFVPADQIVGRATRVAFSVDGERAAIWEVWKWPFAIRYGRIFDTVE